MPWAETAIRATYEAEPVIQPESALEHGLLLRGRIPFCITLASEKTGWRGGGVPGLPGMPSRPMG
jgi:hypothetical protein